MTYLLIYTYDGEQVVESDSQVNDEQIKSDMHQDLAFSHLVMVGF